MFEKLTAFIDRHDFFILTTHDTADADGLGAQLAFASILSAKGKRFRIINASPMPDHFRFMDPHGIVEHWDKQHELLPEQAAMIILDTGDADNTGQMKSVIYRTREVFVFDHHEPKENSEFSGVCDSTAASTCEMALEYAQSAGFALDRDSAFALYTGIAYDTGFFAYTKTGQRTFRAALALLTSGVNPNETYCRLCEKKTIESLLLQQKAVSSMTLHNKNRIAMQVLHPADFDETGALSTDTDGIVNMPLRAEKIQVSLLFKQVKEGKVKCSLRSKGDFNIAAIAQELGGGGHINAAGFKSVMEMEKIIAKTLAMVSEKLEEQG